MHKITLAIIGCGAAAKRYYCPAIRRQPGLIKGLILVDKNIASARALRDEIGGGQICDDYHLAIDKAQGAIIAVPHFLHHKIAMDFLDAGVHVLCEKPLAEFPYQARQMVDKAISKGVSLCVNNSRRIYPAFREIRDLIRNSSLGQILSIEYIEGNTFGWQVQQVFTLTLQFLQRVCCSISVPMP